MALLSNKYEQGHYLKAFISALAALADDKTLGATSKLVLIKNLLQPNNERLKNEKDLLDCFKNLKQEKTINSSTLKERLKKLLGDHTEKLLVPFASKYFSKDKPLQTRDLNAIARGVHGEWLRLEHTKELAAQMSNWYLIQGLCFLSEIARLQGTPSQHYGRAIYDVFQTIFKLSDEDMKYYIESFSSIRSESALLTYLARIRTLSASDAFIIEKEIRDFVKGVLTENRSGFLNARYNEELHKHLKVVFDYHPRMRDFWTQNQIHSYNDFIEINHIEAKPFMPDYAAFYNNKIYQNKHLNPVHYPLLKNYLEATDKKTKESIRNSLESALKKILEPAALDGAKSKAVKNNKNALRIQFQLQLIDLLELGNVNAKLDVKSKKELSQQQKLDHKKCIQAAIKILTQLNEGYEFRNDLQGLLKGFDSSSRKVDLSKTKEWKLCFTDNYWDLFLCGTDVEGSCQRINGDPKLNRCLLAYALDGKNKMIALKDETGKLVARAIVRLLWDEKDKVPVMYLEETYPHFLSDLHSQALEKFASYIAQDMGITLVSSQATLNSVKYPNPLTSLGGIGPEYVDAIHKQVEDGVFTISNAQVLATPTSKSHPFPQSLHFAWKEKEAVSLLQLSQSKAAEQDTAEAPKAAEQDAAETPETEKQKSVATEFSASAEGLGLG